MNRAVFIDRDGTINDHTGGYVKSWSTFRFLPNVLEAFRKLAESDYRIIVVTNQSGVGRGVLDAGALEEINERMLAEVEVAGGRLDAVYVCTHRPSDGCGCRKPETGMLDLAAETYGLNLKESWMIGDNTKDILTGSAAGCKTVLVSTGYGGGDGLYDVEPDYRAADLLEAVGILLSSI